jgi:hypothetical protein
MHITKKEDVQPTQSSTSVKEGVKSISIPTKSKKLEYTVYNSIIKRSITKSGYKLTIPEFPNVELYLTNETSTQDSQEGSTEFNTKSKTWGVEVVHPTKGIMTIGTPFATTMVEVLETFTNDINKKYSKTENGKKILKEIGIDFIQPTTQSSTSVEKKELFTVEKGIAQKSFRGKPIKFVENIDSKKETVVAMSNNRETGVITIDQKGMEQKFNDKTWTTPAKQLDGSLATPLAENEFGSVDEWFTFALIHETKHDTILQQEGETTGQYEDRINQAALEDLRKNYNIPTNSQFDPNNDDLEGGDEPNLCGQ